MIDAHVPRDRARRPSVHELIERSADPGPVDEYDMWRGMTLAAVMVLTSLGQWNATERDMLVSMIDQAIDDSKEPCSIERQWQVIADMSLMLAVIRVLDRCDKPQSRKCH